MSPIVLDILRAVVLLAVLYLLFRAQRFWFVRAWRLAARVGNPMGRMVLRLAWGAALLAVVSPLALWMTGVSRSRYPLALLAMWLSSAFFAYLGVQMVAGAEWLWHRFRARFVRKRKKEEVSSASELALLPAEIPVPERLANPSRRYFFQTAAFAAGAAPFAVSAYGFFAERLRYRLERIEVPIPGLPAALDGLRIAQLSDIHIGAYMPREQVRRAVEMANELGAELAVVTGDFVTSASDPLEDCIEELAGLRAPLGLWGCNGNHEIYAGCEARATRLFQQIGGRILRGENSELLRQGQSFNLMGVDYQRQRTLDGRRAPMLAGAEQLVRRDVPNILLSHNPNAFPRAAKLGIELTLAGHTHGGQVQVEILNRRLSPAAFFTPFVAGLYQLPRGNSQPTARGDKVVTTESGGQVLSEASPTERPHATSSLYVNRGIGTVGTPVRFNSPPEVTLLTLRRA